MARTNKSILQRARRLLVEGGWVRETYHRGKCYCQVGAVIAAMNGPEKPFCVKTTAQAVQAAKLLGYPSLSAAIGANDSANSKEEILANFDRALQRKSA